MKRTALFLFMTAIAVLLAGGVALLGVEDQAQAAFPGKNGKIAFVGAGDIYTVNPDGSSLKNLTNTPEHGEWRPTWSPDGAKIALSRYNFVDFNGDIWTMNAADGSGLKNLTNTPAVHETDPAWSPDGKKIAFVRDGDIWTMNAANGSNKTQIADSQSGDGHHYGYRFPDWSPDGTKIAYSSEWAPDEFGEEIRTDLFVMNADGTGTPTSITNNDYCFDAYFPDWSPDGTKIAFENGCWKADEKDIYVANPNGTEAQNLTSEMELEQKSPTFSPDGTKIVFEDNGSGGTLYLMNTDGSGKTPLTNPATSEPLVGQDPDWQPITAPPAELCTIMGTKGSDVLQGTKRNDVICGRGGSDAIEGRGGNDILKGGSGSDAIKGDGGADKLYGGDGMDALLATDEVRGNDAMNGGGGTDACLGDQRDTKMGCEAN